ncbi:MAG: phosphate ABC transporter permease PstA [Defluviitaleaceae bacterium]|nr:phosphate ABC transporter permease PstA [Defluviitaleaceae bacterium]
MSRTKISDTILASLTWIFAGFTIFVLMFIILYILVNGVPHLTPTLFEIRYTTDNVSMFPSIVSTIVMVFLTLTFAVPLGIFTGIYLVEYVKRGSKVVMVIRTAANLLAGIPSIVYGLFGLLFFVVFLGMSFSLLAGSLTLSIMILPLVIRTTEEALQSVPDGYREGAFALGAGKLRAVFRIVLPSAMPGIFAGVILAIGRIIGESAALIFTAGTIAQLPESLSNSVRTLTVHMWVLSGEALHTNEAYATGVVLLLVVFFINTVSAFLAKKIAKG